MFDGLKLSRAAGGPAGAVDRAAPGPAKPLERAKSRYIAAWADAERMDEQDRPILPHQRVALQQARKEMGGISKEATADLRSAMARNPGLAGQGATPDGMKRIEQAMAHEGQVRRDPHLRAERFVDDWTALQERRVELGTSYQYTDARKAIEGRMKTMAEGLGRDPQVESILRGKKLELGLEKVREVAGVSMGDVLVRSLSLGRSMGMGR